MTTKTKGNTAKKPASKKNAIDELEESLSQDLAGKLRNKVAKEVAKGPQFDASEDDGNPEPIEKAESAGPLVGKRVRFPDQKGDLVLVGTVTSQSDDLSEVVIDTGDLEWDCQAADCQLLEDEAEESSEEAPAEEAPASEVEETAEAAEETAAEGEEPSPEEATATAVLPAEKPTPAPAPEPKSKAAKKAPPAPKADKTEKTAVQLAEDAPRIIKIEDVIIPADKKPREVNKESEDYQRIKADIKKWGQDNPIEVTSWDEPVLVAGLTRLEILKDLGRTLVKARLRPADTDNQRLYHGLRENHQRHQMHWLETARAIATLVSEGEYKQAEIGKELGIAPSEVTRMIAAIQLPKPLIDLAEKSAYPQSVFTELATAPEPAREKVQELMEAGSDVTVLSVREIAKEARAEEDQKAAEEGAPTRSDKGHGGARNTKPKATRERPRAAYGDLDTGQIGEKIRCRIYADRVELTVVVPHANKNFRGFDPIKAVKEVFDETYGNEDLTVRSHDDLGKAMTEIKAQIA